MGPDGEHPSRPPIVPLESHHDRAAFSCGEDSLDRYIKEQASQDVRRNVAAPFVICDSHTSNKVCGYYTLSAFTVNLADLPPDVIRRLPRYPQVPATLLGRLAVDVNYHGQRLGEHLLMDALARALNQSTTIASASVVAEALNQDANLFYQHFGFIPFPQHPNRLFLPMGTIAALFRWG